MDRDAPFEIGNPVVLNKFSDFYEDTGLPLGTIGTIVGWEDDGTVKVEFPTVYSWFFRLELQHAPALDRLAAI